MSISDDDFIRHGDPFDQINLDLDDERKYCEECEQLTDPEDWDFEENTCKECFKPRR